MINAPIFLNKMRVERTYTGGELLDKWQGISPAADGWKPEEWVASTIRSRFAEDPDTGLSLIRNPEWNGVFLKDLISSDPAGILGKSHYDEYGENLGFLAKIIDSDKRLNIQTHPDRKHAKLYFDSDYGKTEAWYVIDTRIVDGEEPYVLLGFKEGMTKEKWIKLIETQDKKAMVDSMHKIPVEKGDIFLIESGVPHAIGSGCMIVEIQEPTDFTFRVEKIFSSDKEFPEETYHQGIGYEKMYNCFDYSVYTYEDILKKMKLPEIIREKNEDYILQPILRTENTPYFSMEKLTVLKEREMKNDSSFAVAIVLNGEGAVQMGETESILTKSDELFLPCSPVKLKIINKNEDNPLEILFCYPPNIITN